MATVYLPNQQYVSLLSLGTGRYMGLIIDSRVCRLHLLAVGLENGQIHLYTSSTANSNAPSFTPLYVLEAS